MTDPWDGPPPEHYAQQQGEHVDPPPLRAIPGGKALPADTLDATDPLTGTSDPTAPVEAEVASLGAALLDREAALHVGRHITADHMTHPHRCMIAHTIAQLVQDDQPVDLVTVAQNLRAQKIPGAVETLRRIAEATPTTANARRDTESVLRAHEARTERKIRQQIQKAGLHDQPRHLEALQDHIRATETRRAEAERPPTFADTLHEVLERMENGTKTPPKAATGIFDLDELCGGLPIEGLTVAAARPGMGKSTLATSILPNVIADRGNRPAIFFSLEMPRHELTYCLLASFAGLPRLRLMPSDGSPAKLSDADWGRSTRFTAALGALPIHIEDRPTQSPGFMRTAIERVLRETQADAPSVIVVDYLQKVSTEGAPTSRVSNRTQEVGWIAEQLRVFARDYHAPVLALAQLNRNLEGRRDRRPALSDLRESGDIEQDSHLVLGLYRPSYYDEDATDEVDEILVLKNRAGPIGTVRCRYEGGYARWTNLAAGEV